ncbi:ETC complex I subunit [Methyloceanibacter caenitepidi]|uniref:NADH-ubiquinone oxidoreductase 18 kd subunit n=1 Tax=Methyloceanibacter caenitepidi TaxID=1384459 RepID=A0A0A8K3G4_9HYPH|nr:ETC complex I subunit [Methyloceanibacter caenitepidi]BAQ17488.1 NADH-ubiquinone oxidoreductase 18 kd subunit [Methyloceanibacter caenitepidi]
MTARIYKPAQNVMQQGRAATRDWVLEYLPDEPRVIEPLMGWTSSSDTKRQIRLTFSTKEEAIAYAKENGIAYRLEEPPATKIRPKSYAENFKYGRPDSWTH